MRIEILLFDGYDELDAFGPFDVLGVPGFDVALTAVDGPRSVTSGKGLAVDAAAPGVADGVLVPGGGWLDDGPTGVRAEVARGAIPAHLAGAAASGAWIASVCTGAFLLGEAGLLAGHDATTNTNALRDLEGYAGRVLNERVVDSGSVVTANGPSAGIDLALHLIERFLGAEAASARATAIDHRRGGSVFYGR